mmetsp:Transcript_61309/g.143488  ORF Transcript_61309/g.143488 Transcript_61309/m.143488 type:complete len:272 (+) Transcript_61309:750-1565(+)
MTGHDAIDELDKAAICGGVLGALHAQSQSQVLPCLRIALQTNHAMRHCPSLPARQGFHGPQSCDVQLVRFSEGLLRFLVPLLCVLLVVLQEEAVTYAHCHFPHIGKDLGQHDPVTRLSSAVNFPGFRTEFKTNFHLLSLLRLLTQAGVGFAEVPNVEPGCRHAVGLFDFDALPRVLEALLSLVQGGITPSKVAVHDVVELPSLLRLERDQLLYLFQRHERIVRPELLHAHRAELVQRLDQPSATFLPSQRHDSIKDVVALVDLVILEIHAD